MEQTLQKLGFTPNESRVYISAISCGLSSAQDIAKQAELERTTTYSVLKILVKKGFINTSKTKGKTRFLAERPEKLIENVKILEKELRERVPELAARYNEHGVKPKILFYEGQDAIQKVYDDTLTSGPKEILEWNTEAYFGDSRVDQNYIKKRVQHRISAKRIANSGSPWDKVHKERDPFELSKTLIVPQKDFDPKIEINIYDNKIAFLNYAENTSIIIESKAISDAMKQIYNLSWKGGETSEII